jgi:hypothetical protein
MGVRNHEVRKAVADFKIELSNDKDGPNIGKEVLEMSRWKFDIQEKFETW